MIHAPCPSIVAAVVGSISPSTVVVSGFLNLLGPFLTRDSLLGNDANTALRLAILEHLTSFQVVVAFEDVFVVGASGESGSQRLRRQLEVRRAGAPYRHL
jgi:hypothetical protein